MDESPLDHIAKPVCIERICVKSLSLPLPDLNIADDFITIICPCIQLELLVEQENKNS